MKKYSYSLDAFRVLAILCVFVCHLNVFNEGLEGGKIFLGGNIPSIGGLAVHYFILLSAFLGAYFYDKSISHGYLAYVRKRVWRLFPTNWVTLFFYVIVFVWLGMYTMSFWRAIVEVALSSCLLQSLFKFSALRFNAPAWTISTLFVLYLITPLLMWPLKKIKKPWVLIVLVILLTWVDIEYRDWLMIVKPKNSWLNYLSPVCRIFSYLLGLTMGYAARRMTCPVIVRQYATWIELCVFAIFLYGCSMIERDFRLCYLIVMYSTPLIIVICFMGNGKISKMIGACGISSISSYVYAFYMIHFLFILLVKTMCDRMLLMWGNMSMSQVWVAVIFTFISACAASVLLHHYVEKRIA